MQFLSAREDQIYALMRIVFGLLFAFHGAQKLFGLFGGAPGEMPAALLYTAMTLDSALQHWRGRGGLWKGRVHGSRGGGEGAGGDELEGGAAKCLEEVAQLLHVAKFIVFHQIRLPGHDEVLSLAFLGEC